MKDSAIGFFKSGRFKLLWLLYVVVIGISLLTRVVLMIYAGNLADPGVKNILSILMIGLLFDVINAGFFTLPVVIYLWLLPESLFKKGAQRFVLSGLFFVSVFILLFNAVAEYFFWDEFGTRFNFIAVDYLVYTTEVIGNIWQSYPIGWIVTSLTLVTMIVTYVCDPFLRNRHAFPLALKQRTISTVIYVTVPLITFFAIDNRLHNFSDNPYVNELAGNGMYELFAAYKNNELDYERFYPHIDDSIAANNVRTALGEKGAVYSGELNINHEVKNDGQEKRLNVVLISVESLSAEYMGLYGNSKNLTPFLDSLVHHSYVFTSLYATGTRTVRGLEAISLSIPPTPGQSIVRRPHNEHLFTMASVFNEKGYDSKYIYGGYGYFDNMTYFFENNGYTAVDRNSLSMDEIDYENIWGVADENLFSLSIREIDKSTRSHQPAFVHIMTTSNHRPFTYPAGRIDIPSHSGRDGAVRYTDYAIGKFIHEASKKDWYHNTVFIITADHCASSAGKTDLPLRKYLIPLLVFSPDHINPGIESRLMSQIDIAPTVFGLLNFSYESKFYGFDMFKLDKGRERAFISTYQALGFIAGDSMVVLKPGKLPEVRIITKDKEPRILNGQTTELKVVKDAISWYQSASYAFRHGMMSQ